MILGLTISGGSPSSIKDQINASFSAITEGLSRSLVGEIHEVTTSAGDATYREETITISHSLGRKPLAALVMSDTAGDNYCARVDEADYQYGWNDTTVRINLKRNDGVASKKWILLLATP